MVASDPRFERAVEETMVTSKGDLEKVTKAGGLLYDHYPAEEVEVANYPKGVKGLIPRVRGTFAQSKVNGANIYVPHEDETPRLTGKEAKTKSVIYYDKRGLPIGQAGPGSQFFGWRAGAVRAVPVGDTIERVSIGGDWEIACFRKYGTAWREKNHEDFDSLALDFVTRQLAKPEGER